ncbi:MAG: hypothetical protein SO434_00795 [Eubacteriales bacterium]|nr:hypothetical protein [Eubacteriales bacterium]
MQKILDEFLEITSNSQLCIGYAISIDASKDKAFLLAKELIINNAFMNVVTAWERFLERSAIAYSLSTPSVQGNCPKCYIGPIDEEHADELIKGAAQYLDWSNKEQVVNMAERVFQDGEPYKTIISGINSTLQNIKKLRNNIAHNSRKSNREFNNLVRMELSPSEVGISTAQFLLSSKNGAQPFWKIYFTHLTNGVTAIANY